jgi:hypothetical protein
VEDIDFWTGFSLLQIQIKLQKLGLEGKIG